MEQRFPHFVDVFFYNDDGIISKINYTFMWKNYNYITIVPYILELAHGAERRNLEEAVDVKDFICHIHNALRA